MTKVTFEVICTEITHRDELKTEPIKHLNTKKHRK